MSLNLINSVPGRHYGKWIKDRHLCSCANSDCIYRDRPRTVQNTPTAQGT